MLLQTPAVILSNTTAVADSEAWVSPLQQQVSEVGSAFTGIGADKLKKYSIWHNEASVLHQAL